MTPLELISATSAITGSGGATFYFHPDTLAKGKEVGLDGFRFYLLGRGGVLGDVEAPVVASAFAYFSGPLVARLWESARTIVPPREAGRLYHECCAARGRAALADVAGLEAYNEAAEQVIDAANPAGLALFAGIAAEPRAEDAPGRALQLMAVLRELRGSVHIVANVASGIDPVVAHAMRRPDDVATFGYETAPTITDADWEKQRAADALTDQLLVPAYSVLDDAGRTALRDGTEAIGAALGV